MRTGVRVRSTCTQRSTASAMRRRPSQTRMGSRTSSTLILTCHQFVDLQRLPSIIISTSATVFWTMLALYMGSLD